MLVARIGSEDDTLRKGARQKIAHDTDLPRGMHEGKEPTGYDGWGGMELSYLSERVEQLCDGVGWGG